MIEQGIVAVVASMLSVATGVVAYRRQRIEARRARWRRVLVTAQEFAPIAPSVSGADLQRSRQELVEAFEVTRARLTRALDGGEGEAALEIARLHAGLASAVAARSVPSVLDGAPRSHRLNRARLCDLHRRLLPDGYELAGRFREVDRRDGREDPTPANPVRYLPSGLVAGRVDALIWRWNHEAPDLHDRSRSTVLEHLARFHVELIGIRPFMNGNRALGRLLLGMQLRDFVDRAVTPEPSEAYDEALRAASGGDLGPLRHWIVELPGM